MDIVSIERLVHATPRIVWRAWTEPELIQQWFGSDPDGWGIKTDVDLRIGGKFKVNFSNSDRTEHTCYGIYKEVNEFIRLQFTWTWIAEPGVESLVTIELKPENNITRMRFEHSKLGQESAHNYQLGWTSTFEKLDRLISKMNEIS